MSTGHDIPPSEWGVGAQQVGDSDVYIRLGDTAANTIVWHWCPGGCSGDGVARWVGADISLHTIVSREPLHIEASLLMPGCGWHGFIRSGQWQPA